MSELSRLQRLAKSLVPNFGKKRERYYNFDDAKMMINDLALEIPADMLAKLLDSDTLLDDFLMGLYQIEDHIGKKDVVLENHTLNPDYQPRVYVEENRIAFSLTYGSLMKKEIVFAEYTL